MIEIILLVVVLFLQAIIFEVLVRKYKVKKFWPFYISLFVIFFVFYFIFEIKIKMNLFYGILYGFVSLCIVTLPMFVYEAKKAKKQARPTKLYELLKDIFAVPAEELIFRGLLFSMLSATFGVLVAVVVSSAIFSLWHLNFNWQFLLIVFASGLGFAALYLISSSILAPIILHASLNIGEYTIKPALNRGLVRTV